MILPVAISKKKVRKLTEIVLLTYSYPIVFYRSFIFIVYQACLNAYLLYICTDKSVIYYSIENWIFLIYADSPFLFHFHAHLMWMKRKLVWFENVKIYQNKFFILCIFRSHFISKIMEFFQYFCSFFADVLLHIWWWCGFLVRIHFKATNIWKLSWKLGFSLVIKISINRKLHKNLDSLFSQ